MDIAALKQRIRDAWSLGDYDKLAEQVTAPAARALVDACGIASGQDVLDVAAGTGNVAILAAQRGARVVASDLTPAMVERGRERCHAAGLAIEWVIADAEELPFEDASFDCVTSVFGAMFAPRPELVARELFRVVRPGGKVALATWKPDSFVAEQSAVSARYIPPDPELPNPTDWSDPDIVARRFEGLAESIETSVHTTSWKGESPEAYVAFTQENAGPQIAAKRALDGETAAAWEADLLACARRHAQGDGPVTLSGRFLVAVARARG